MNKKRVTETRIVLFSCLKETNSLMSLERVELVYIDAGICGNLCHSCTFPSVYTVFTLHLSRYYIDCVMDKLMICVS